MFRFKCCLVPFRVPPVSKPSFIQQELREIYLQLPASVILTGTGKPPYFPKTVFLRITLTLDDTATVKEGLVMKIFVDSKNEALLSALMRYNQRYLLDLDRLTRTF